MTKFLSIILASLIFTLSASIYSLGGVEKLINNSQIFSVVVDLDHDGKSEKEDETTSSTTIDFEKEDPLFFDFNFNSLINSVLEIHSKISRFIKNYNLSTGFLIDIFYPPKY